MMRYIYVGTAYRRTTVEPGHTSASRPRCTSNTLRKEAENSSVSAKVYAYRASKLVEADRHPWSRRPSKRVNRRDREKRRRRDSKNSKKSSYDNQNPTAANNPAPISPST